MKDRSEAFQRFSRAVDGPMTVLALAMLPLIVVPLVVELSPGQARAVLAVDYLIWAACYAWRAWRGWSLLPVEGLQEARETLRRRGLSWVLLIVVALNLVAAALVLTFEQDTPAGNIHSYPDALWWR